MLIEDNTECIRAQYMAIEEMSETMCECAIKTITNMLMLARGDMKAYIQLRDMKSIFHVPFIGENRLCAIVRKCGNVIEDRVSDYICSYYLYMRDCKEYGIEILGCFRSERTKELVNDGVGIYLAPYLGRFSFDLTVEAITNQFLKNEFGKKKIDIEARYIYRDNCIEYKGTYLIPNYDKENRLISAKRR